MVEQLNIQLLGGFFISLNDQPIGTLRTVKTRALLAYLATEADQVHSRVKLATLFWGELSDAAARTNLRIELSNLKRVLSAHPALEVTRTSVCLHSVLATVDVQQFRKELATYAALPVEAQATALPRLVAAIERYQGEFLAGFQLNDAIEFEDWQLITREQLHEQMMHALRTLQARYAEQGRWRDLATTARRQIAIVPWTEAAHRNLIQALAAQGETQAALAQFERCREILQEELGVEPSLPTLELVARLRGEGTPFQRAQHNLAPQLKAFVGRAEEITRLRALLQQEKLVTLLGIGGVGKSHLAQAVAQNVLHDFADGVWFVPLANVDEGDFAADRVALAIAAAVGFQVTDMQAPLAELSAYLATKQMLLVLDNWEHLVDVAATVLYALLDNPGVRVLATSRVRLMTAGEVPVHVDGLPPTEAFALFVDRGRRIVPTFAVGDETVEEDDGLRADILRLCAQVAGLPLGIELAASWVEHYSVAEIGQSIAEIAIQPEQRDGLVGRHHTLHGVLEFSWQLLAAHQQKILARIAIFRDGFDRAAAMSVAESTLSDLSTLIAHSLVQRVGAGRYDLHPLIQEFAAANLPQATMATLHGKHAHYYLGKLLATDRENRAAHLQIDFENVRLAWQYAIEIGDVTLIQQVAETFAEFMAQFGLATDGDRLFATAVARFVDDPGQNEFVAFLLDQQAIFVRSLHGLQGVRDIQRKVLTLAHDPKVLVRAHLDLANYHAEVGEWEEADLHFDRAEEFAKTITDLNAYIDVTEGRIFINALHFRGDYACAIQRLEEMLTLLDREDALISDRDKLRQRVVQSMGVIAMRYGDYALAIRNATQVLAWANATTHRQLILDLLLDLALAEQFAGYYDEAVAHNRESLMLAEETHDIDEMGLLNANLCLTLRQSGDYEEALMHGLRAIELLVVLGNKRIEGQARNRVGHSLLGLARWEDAYAAYGEALRVWASFEHPNHYEAVAGRALAAFHLGKVDEALTLVNEVLAFVEQAGLGGIVEPAFFLLNCEAVLSGVGKEKQAQQVLLQAEAWMQMIAARITDDAVRATFLYKRPDNERVRSCLATFA